MRCYYCGKTVSDEYSFCPFCGKPLEGVVDDMKLDFPDDPGEEEAGNVATDETEGGKSPERAKKGQTEIPAIHPYTKEELEAELSKTKTGTAKKDKKKKRKVKIILLIIILLLAIAGAAYGYSAYMEANKVIYKVNLIELVNEPEIEGYNGYAVITDGPSMNQVKARKVIEGIEDEEYSKYMRKLLNSVEYEADSEGPFSNGDEIKITASYNEDFALEKEIIVTGLSETVTVEGLEEGEDLAFKMSDFKDYDKDFAFPESYKEYIPDDEIDGAAKTVIQQGINEIYARHGYIFGDNDYGTYFNSCEWYIPMYSDEEFKSKWLNKYEQENLSKLGDYRTEIRQEEEAVEKQQQEENARKEAEEKKKAEESTKAKGKKSKDKD